MNVALILLGYAALLATAGTAVLRRAGWVDRAPHFGIVVWQAMTLSVVLAVAFGGLALVVPIEMVSLNLAQLVDSCAMMLSSRYSTPGGAVLATFGLAVAAAVIGRVLYCVLRELGRGGAVRRRHLSVLSVAGRTTNDPGVTILDDERPFVYCIAGWRQRIVMTTGADVKLGPAQLNAVLSHERAHLRARHYIVIAVATGMARAFPGVGLFAAAWQEVIRLVELAADDAATRTADRLDLAEAMLNLSAADPPAGALASGGSTAAARVRRLITGRRPLGRWAVALGVMAVLTLIAVPAVTLSTPALMSSHACCMAHDGKE